MICIYFSLPPNARIIQTQKTRRARQAKTHKVQLENSCRGISSFESEAGEGSSRCQEADIRVGGRVHKTVQHMDDKQKHIRVDHG